MPDGVQHEQRALVKLLLEMPTEVHSKADAWIERTSGGKYRSMLAVVEGDETDVEARRKLLTELCEILREGDLVKLEEST